jgi:ribosomal protein S18 acetylase RimI-like enzyme
LENEMADGLNNNAKPTAPLVVVAEQRHLDGLVACHCLALPDRVMTRLGPSFLRAHFRYYIRHPKGIVLAALDPDGSVIGYTMGGAPWLRKRFLWTHALSLGPIILWKALTDPVVRARLREPAPLVADDQRQEGAAVWCGWPDDPPETTGRLLFLATHPDHRRKGVGRALLVAFRHECSRRGFRTMQVMTQNVNGAAIGLYRSAGWQITGVSRCDTYFWSPVDSTDHGA